MPRDAVSRTANVEGTARHQWVKRTRTNPEIREPLKSRIRIKPHDVRYRRQSTKKRKQTALQQDKGNSEVTV